MAEKSNIAKLPELTPKFWEFVGGKVAEWVRADCRKGIMQDGSANHPLSRKYKKYKDNDMRRFTDGKRLGDTATGTGKTTDVVGGGFTIVNGQIYRVEHRTTRTGKVKKTLKQRRFPLVGKSLQTIGTPYVTMMLTGDTMRGLKPEKPTKDGVTMAFNPKDSVKIWGNQQIGYNVVGLNRVNIELVRQQIIKEFNKNKVKYLNKDIKIGVRF